MQKDNKTFRKLPTMRRQNTAEGDRGKDTERQTNEVTTLIWERSCDTPGVR